MATAAIVGSRDLDEFGEEPRRIVFKVVRRLSRNDPEVVVVSGGARGIDTIAAEAARAICKNRPRVHRPDFKTHGSPRALFVRNMVIVEDADQLVCIWNGRSRGSLHAIRCAIEKGIPVFVYNLWTRTWADTTEKVLAMTGPLGSRPKPHRRPGESTAAAAFVGSAQMRGERRKFSKGS